MVRGGDHRYRLVAIQIDDYRLGEFASGDEGRCRCFARRVCRRMVDTDVLDPALVEHGFELLSWHDRALHVYNGNQHRRNRPGKS